MAAVHGGVGREPGALGRVKAVVAALGAAALHGGPPIRARVGACI